MTISFWENPDEFDIDRENKRAHMGFGYGIHACLGQRLARMEVRIAVAELLRRTSSLVTVVLIVSCIWFEGGWRGRRI